MSAPAMAEEIIYTVKEVAERLRIAPKTVRKMIADGELRYFVVRGEYRIRQSALDEVMKDRERKEG